MTQVFGFQNETQLVLENCNLTIASVAIWGLAHLRTTSNKAAPPFADFRRVGTTDDGVGAFTHLNKVVHGAFAVRCNECISDVRAVMPTFRKPVKSRKVGQPQSWWPKSDNHG